MTGDTPLPKLGKEVIRRSGSCVRILSIRQEKLALRIIRTCRTVRTYCKSVLSPARRGNTGGLAVLSTGTVRTGTYEYYCGAFEVDLMWPILFLLVSRQQRFVWPSLHRHGLLVLYRYVVIQYTVQ